MTEWNPARRFWGCPMYTSGARNSSCGYFQWFDPPTCPRGKEVLLPLIKKMKKMEEAAREQKTKDNRMLKCLLICFIASWILFFAM
ncbi:hypothetical protein CJ030_MR8G020177 [Morella rubra]|uniref:Zinc finger GRF-type domain-containing protein n=1 Tax=Morella rubra TaxID=262757 RepID=A0A6A1UTK8_9ROSI|nr:hypothetical protein CJ030_MR8G020177 [Morella rubra]